MKKRGWSLFLALVLCLSLLPATAWAEGGEDAGDTETTTVNWTDAGNYDTSWYDESKSEFTISTAAQLAGLASLVNGGNNFSGKTIKLGAEIDLNNKAWTPIGKYTGYATTADPVFQGTFDGQGHTVSGLCVNINATGYYTSGGLFGYVKSGTVQNVNVSGKITVESNNYVYVGGVVGRAENTTVENCSFSGAVTGTGTGNGGLRVGGVVGYAYGSTTVKNCSNSGVVTAESASSNIAGGVVGGTSGTSITVEGCRNTGAVSNTSDIGSTGTDIYTGGVVGNAENAYVNNCYNTGAVKSTHNSSSSFSANNTGGVVGSMYDTTTVSNCYNTGSVTGTGTGSAQQNTGGAVGWMPTSGTTVSDCYFLQDEDENINSSLNAIGSGSGTNVEGKNSEAFAGGEVACLLQGEQEGTDTDPIWVQVKGTDGTYYPALYALLSEDEQVCTVYEVTFQAGENESVKKYAVAGGNVAEIPIAPEGYAWCTGNEEFTASTVVTEDLTVTAKTRAAAPTAAPELDSRTTSSIKLKEVAANGNNAAAQYGISTDNGWTWQDNPEFTGLTSGTEYTFALRYGGTDDYAPSLPSDTVKISTDEQPSVVEPVDPVDPVVPVTPPAVVTPTYPPVIEDTEHGTVSVTPANPRQGSTVTVTPKPETGYEVAGVTVTDRSGNPVKVTDNGDGTYSFTQPAGKVTISVAYVCDGLTDNCPSYHLADVDTSAWYHLAVDFVVENGLMSGYGNGSFGPNDTLTRAELAQILYNKEDRPSVSGSVFTDVADGAWYANAVNWANRNGIVTGYGSGKFGPGDPVTREQMATILYRYLAAKGYDITARADLSGYTDAGQISAYATEAMSWANAVGLLTGETPTTLVPQGNATRAQVATILMRFCESLEK